MTQFSEQTLINAPPRRCFELLRDPRLHGCFSSDVSAFSAPKIGEVVTFETIRLGSRRIFRVKAIEVIPPSRLLDVMTHGPFLTFSHLHELAAHGAGTILIDTVEWTSPFGAIGRLADSVYVRRHLRRIVRARNERLKQISEY